MTRLYYVERLKSDGGQIEGPVSVRSYLVGTDVDDVVAVVVNQVTGEHFITSLRRIRLVEKTNSEIVNQAKRALRARADGDIHFRQAVIDLGLEWNEQEPEPEPLEASFG